eukprot:CAMPEP_0117472844 /NCGR_PEP_ID=MMETSP0784-20121206/8460_1 /TAXON_ID=39447 /ORGANISM="" /LENGTH=107 /DNA_ID=CAMNT_0005267015 /DNA_START=286 /DNA_END=609 /DNA_ORIENTATION=+
MSVRRSDKTLFSGSACSDTSSSPDMLVQRMYMKPSSRNGKMYMVSTRFGHSNSWAAPRTLQALPTACQPFDVNISQSLQLPGNVPGATISLLKKPVSPPSSLSFWRL